MRTKELNLLPTSCLEDSEAHAAIMRYETIRTGELINSFSRVELLLLPLIRNWLYLFFSKRYRYPLPFTEHRMPNSDALIIPESFSFYNKTCLTDFGSCLENPIAILSNEQVAKMRAHNYYGLSIIDSSVVLSATKERLFDWISPNKIMSSSFGLAPKTMQEVGLAFDITSIQQYVYHATNKWLNIDFLQFFIHRACNYMVSLFQIESLEQHDSIFWFDMFTEQAIGIGAYCIACGKLSVEIAHGSFFSAYGHTKIGVSPALPDATLDPYETLALVFGRFHSHIFLGPSDLKNTELRYNHKSYYPTLRSRKFWLVTTPDELEELTNSCNQFHLSSVFIVDNGADDPSCPNLNIAISILSLEAFRKCANRGELYLISHPILGKSSIISEALSKAGLRFNSMLGINSISHQPCSQRDGVNRAAFITFSETATWRDLLLFSDLLHIHAGRSPLGLYLKNLWVV
jgi:hypothetical protein